MTLNLKLQNTTLHFINEMYIIYMHQKKENIWHIQILNKLT